MFERILVPLDGSAVAEQAIPLAGRLARATGGTVVLLRIVLPPDEYEYEFSMLRSASIELDPGMHTALEAAVHYLEEVAASNYLTGVEIETVTSLGPAAAMIVSAGKARGIDLIVMSSHGNTSVSRCVLDSVSQAVTRHASMPVLVLPQQTTPFGSHPSMERPPRVLVPLDGSSLSKAALEPAAQLAAALSAPSQGAIHLLRVVPHDPTSQEALDTAPTECLLHEAKADLASIADQMRKGIAADLKLAVTWSVTLNSEVAHAIIRGVEGREEPGGAGTFGGCDLIALATHARLCLQRLALGSVAECILAETRVPVLIIRPEYGAGEETMNREVVHT